MVISCKETIKVKTDTIMDVQRIIDTDIPDIAPVYGGVRGRSMSSKGLGVV